MKRISKEPSLQQQLREMCNCNIDTSPCGAELECRACFNAADLLDECETLIVAMRQEIQNLGGSLEGVITADATLAKLRAQEKADDVPTTS